LQRLVAIDAFGRRFRSGLGGLLLYIIIFIGAGIGGALRHCVNLGAARLFGVGFPFGTFIVNVAGSFVMGLLGGYFAYRAGVPQYVRLFLTTGILGGFTTFSAFSLDAALLVERHAYVLAAGYVLGTVAAGLAALFLGLAVFRGIGHLP
jgi:fluoride exporter